MSHFPLTLEAPAIMQLKPSGMTNQPCKLWGDGGTLEEAALWKMAALLTLLAGGDGESEPAGTMVSALSLGLPHCEVPPALPNGDNGVPKPHPAPNRGSLVHHLSQ